ncbi:ArsR/SmtB family transcription factor [Clostridium algidicarnis]|uniref:Metalloregulator ArsR/SmtB family transcription factor n=1 Tax=Clostridium algidicarnis TaxID=37659 RepID=A0ABS6C1J0_9CLOT|nr:metalloregulator ArsR/SmtB family transcription factor [Clostridium algidicarnis]MBB6696764.1 winged helix-turn-helix transcriptional regulator [Clostridium algidicarnis]MBU3192711.1 metalloregulator ArsR/SmtB family transcription factor [Clostridium algidicarnis]MBU3204036.1 metalloregulator ArsR/SmtB family transcription factor [Clostridium algidicarnis]MBU3212190.1 metalloregulator ArsR/SmtB family transcription factor [Clostridium algidicarnis]MBU3219347.1 metalloregulator ArsR/SmtB fam
MDNNYKRFDEVAELLKVMAHPVRICILNGLIKKGECNVTFMQGCLEVPQSTISQHLQKLKAAGLVQSERRGLEVIYSIKDPRVKLLMGILIKE